uniref:AlNc14C2450G13240 protein n=1 Tax=Albugo laibachii Nc14 TaxID=890382 RepID=F0X2Y1_9STRA|nr:AlNc14C2450G13240 [Albugo laibachii Nc14]|eukprot:CCA28344.1 AlNc14C2450G13240 [Albugo laibachii Nc14]
MLPNAKSYGFWSRNDYTWHRHCSFEAAWIVLNPCFGCLQGHLHLDTPFEKMIEIFT